MYKYSLSWNDFRNNGSGWEKSTWPKQILNFVLAMVVFYLIIGLFSLLAISYGADISYMPLWHEPWRWLIQTLLPLKEVIPNGGTPV